MNAAWTPTCGALLLLVILLVVKVSRNPRKQRFHANTKSIRVLRERISRRCEPYLMQVFSLHFHACFGLFHKSISATSRLRFPGCTRSSVSCPSSAETWP